MDESIVLTDLEKQMLKKIAHSVYSASNGKPQQAADTPTFIWDVIESPEDKGVVTSLKKKGLAEITKYKNSDDNSIELTKLGFHMYLVSLAKE
jgi:hypothetical protein